MHHRQVQAGDAIGREVHGMSAVFEEIAKIGGDVLVVFNDEDAHGTFLGGGFDRPATPVRDGQ